MANLKDGEEAGLPAGPVSHDDELEAILQNCKVIICVRVLVLGDVRSEKNAFKIIFQADV